MTGTADITRQYFFMADKPNEAAKAGLRWVCETGGTIVTNLKQTIEKTFDLDTAGQYSDFENYCHLHGVGIQTLRGHSCKPTGKRLFALYVDEENLAETEEGIERHHACDELEEMLLLVWNEQWIKNWVKRYDAQLIGEAPEGWHECIKGDGQRQPIPEDIQRILKHLAAMAKGYGNSMKWNEEAKLKSDLMKNWQYWAPVSVEAIRMRCGELGMSLKDIKTITDMIQKRKDGRRLVPDSSYKDFEFKH